MAYDFNGTNQYLTIGSCPVSAVPITIAIWYNGDTAPSTAIPFIVVWSSSSNDRINIAKGNAANDIVATYIDEGVSNAASTALGAYSTGSWKHACGVFSSNSSRAVYSDGVAATENTASLAALSSFDRITIGSNHVASLFHDGKLAEVGIWNVALTADEIASLAKGMTCDKVRPQSLVFYAPLVRELQDVKGGLTITNNNTATVANHPRVYA
jgi:hypothetical protein